MSDLAARPRLSSRLLPGAVALAALTNVALASDACGGKVVIDGLSTASTGGSGGTSATGGSGALGSSVATDGSGGSGGSAVDTGGGGGVGEGGSASDDGGAVCTVVPMPPFLVMLGCAPGSNCPAGNTVDAKNLVSKALGLCNPAVSACCGNEVFEGIVCGPSPSDGDCCYVTLTSVHTCG